MILGTLLFASEGEFSLAKIALSKDTRSAYFNAQHAPDVFTSIQCREKCSGDGCCWPVIRNQNNEILRSYSSDDSINAVAHARYKDNAYLYFSQFQT